MHDVWSQVGVISGALLALFTLLGLVWTKVVRPMFRAGRRFIRRMNEVADDLLGDAARGIPSMVDRQVRTERAVAELRTELADHIARHDAASALPAPNNRAPTVAPLPRRRAAGGRAR